MTADDPIRVLVVDDSSVVRRVLTQLLGAEPDLVVAGAARDGQEALDIVGEVQPHVVVLDIEMPRLDGLGTLRQLRPRFPKLPVVMFSTLTERGAAATLDALSAGANDYVAKPSNTGALANAMAVLHSSLVPLVREWGRIGRRRSALAAAHAIRPGPQPAQEPDRLGAASRRHRVTRRLVTAVAIGASTGGPNALAELVPQLPADLPVPVLLVQHMPETFTRLLARRLDATSSITVVEAVPGTPVRAGVVTIARGGIHLAVARSGGEIVVEFDDGPPENSCKPSVDVLFRSAAACWGPGVLGVVMTGMGQDGLLGARAVDAAGGEIIAQDESTSVVWGMPGAVARAGLPTECVPLDGLPLAITSRIVPAHRVVPA